MIKTVVFDLDDTLYDEIEYCKSGFGAVSEFIAEQNKNLSPDSVFDCFWNEFTAGNRTQTFNAALAKLGISFDNKLITELIGVYRNHRPQIALPADSRDVLDQFSEKYTLALLSDGFLPAQQLKVQALGIEKYFKCIIYTEQLDRQFGKPSPVGFEKLMTELNAKPENSVYVADNEKKDFIAPNKLGFLTVQLIRSAHIHTETNTEPGAAAKHIIQKITQLQPLLQKS